MPSLLQDLQAHGIQPSGVAAPQTPVTGQSSLLRDLQAQGINPSGTPTALPSTNPVSTPPKAPGFLQSVAQSVAHAPLRILTTGTNALEAAAQAMQGDYKAADATTQKTRDFGYFGKAEPVGAYQDSKSLEGNLGQGVKDIVGTGAEIAPYFLGGGFTPNTPGLAGLMGAGMKTGATTGGLSSFGRSLQKPDASLPSVAAETGLGMVGGGLVGGVMPAVQAGVRRGFSLLTGTHPNVLAQASNPETVDAVRDATAILKQDPQNPYTGTVKEIAAKLASQKEAASQALTAAKDNFVASNPGVVFPVSGGAKDMADSLSSFGIEAVPKAGGGWSLNPTGMTQFTSQEITQLNKLFNEVSRVDTLSPDDLVRFPSVFDRFYRQVPYSPQMSATPYHAAVLQMKDAYSDAVEASVPDGIKAAFSQYRAFNQAMDDWGSKIVDKFVKNGAPDIKPGAETFVSNLLSKNKGILDEKVPEWVLGDVQAMKSAQALRSLVPTTGDRTLDVWRAVMLPMLVGGGTVNPIAGAGAALATSPKVIGNIAMGIADASKAGLTQPIKTAVTSGLAEPFAKMLMNKISSLDFMKQSKAVKSNIK